MYQYLVFDSMQFSEFAVLFLHRTAAKWHSSPGKCWMETMDSLKIVRERTHVSANSAIDLRVLLETQQHEFRAFEVVRATKFIYGTIWRENRWQLFTCGEGNSPRG